jgi:nitrite reductase (NO-forming)
VQRLAVARNRREQIQFGQRVYETNCVACHQAEGAGIARAFPPLTESDFLNEDHERAIDILLYGMSGKIKVNDLEYDGYMPAISLSNSEIANVLTFVLNSWGNTGGRISARQVEARRSEGSAVRKDAGG